MEAFLKKRYNQLNVFLQADLKRASLEDPNLDKVICKKAYRGKA
jgi:hypothetical protein